MLHWSGTILGHFGLLAILHMLFADRPLWALTSAIVFYYYFKGISFLRKKRFLTLMILKGYQQLSAEEVLLSGQPYGLFLRGFDHDKRTMAHYDLLLGLGEETATLGLRLRAGHVEHLLTKMLNVPLISLADPRIGAPTLGSHKFLAPPSNWEDLVEKVGSKATITFLYYVENTPGLFKEMEIILHHIGWRNVILIFGREMTVSLQPTSHLTQTLERLSKSRMYVVFQNGGRLWGRRHEKKFKTNVIARLTNLERDRKQQSNLVASNWNKIPLMMEPRLYVSFKVLATTLLWFVPFMVLVVYFADPTTPVYELKVLDIMLMALAYLGTRLFVMRHFQERDGADVWVAEDEVLRNKFNENQDVVHSKPYSLAEFGSSWEEVLKKLNIKLKDSDFKNLGDFPG